MSKYKFSIGCNRQLTDEEIPNFSETILDKSIKGLCDRSQCILYTEAIALPIV